MKVSSAIKKAAKIELSDNWSKAFAAMGIMLLFSLLLFLAQSLVVEMLRYYGIINRIDSYVMGVDALSDAVNWLNAYIDNTTTIYGELISLFFMMLSFLLITPLRQGVYTWYYTVAAGKNPQLGNMFLYYRSSKRYIESLIFQIRLYLRKLVCGIIAYITPAIALAMTIYQSIKYVESGDKTQLPTINIYIALTGVLFILGTLLYVLLAARYFLARYLYAKRTLEEGSTSMTACFGDSKRYMGNRKGHLITFAISFFPWLLLCLFVLPLIYVIPYMKCSFAEFADYVIDANEGRS